VFSCLIVSIVRLYQLTISAVLGNRCRFYPSCSQYTIEAVEKFGPMKGILLGVRRLSRCHPFCEGGIDPVTETTTTDHKV
jgi:putative membrane protein insertion efficiency factor